MRHVGKMGGRFSPLGVESTRYVKPVMAAKNDWMVFRTREKVNRSVLGPPVILAEVGRGYSVVVRAS
jgi:hypothetical protein